MTVDASRSSTMRAVHSRDTAPELKVRRLLRKIAPGYRLHRDELPGKPDIAYIGRRIAIFVHGCFWHGHDCARGARVPKTNTAYWQAKVQRNRARDVKVQAGLAGSGWKTIVIWECELNYIDGLKRRLEKLLSSSDG